MKALRLEYELEYTERGLASIDRWVTVSETIHCRAERIVDTVESMKTLSLAGMKEFHKALHSPVKGSVNVNYILREYDADTYMDGECVARLGIYSSCDGINAVYEKRIGQSQKEVSRYTPEWDGDDRSNSIRSEAMARTYNGQHTWSVIVEALNKWLADHQ